MLPLFQKFKKGKSKPAMVLKVIEGRGNSQQILCSIGGIDKMDFSSPFTEDSKDVIEYLKEAVQANQLKEAASYERPLIFVDDEEEDVF